MAYENKTLGERVVFWATAFGLVVPSVLSLYAALLKGEPGADEAKKRVNRTWQELKLDVNKLERSQHILHKKLARFQSLQEGESIGVLKEKNEQLQAKIDQLLTENKKTKSRNIIPMVKRVLATKRKMNEAIEEKVKADKAVKEVPMPTQQRVIPPWNKEKR